MKLYKTYPPNRYVWKSPNIQNSVLAPWFEPASLNWTNYGVDLIYLFSKNIYKIQIKLIVEDVENNLKFTARGFLYESKHYIFLHQTGDMINTKYSIKDIDSIKLVWNIQILNVWNNDGRLVKTYEWYKYDIL